MSSLLRRLSYANVMSTIAVFFVLSGAGAFAISKIGPKNIKKGAVRSRQVRDGSLLAKDFKAGELPTGSSVVTAPGSPSNGPSNPAVESPTTVTSFQNGWAAYDAGTPADTSDDAPVSYWKDLSGVVHLEGGLTHTSPVADQSVMFVLPQGYRPASNYASFPVLTSGFSDFDEVLGFVQITAPGCCPSFAGEVRFDGGNPEYVSLDGVTFRGE